MSEFHFLRPWFLLALPLVFGAAWALWRARRHSRQWQAVCDPELLPHLLVGGSAAQRSHIAPWLLGLVGTLLVTALAGPVWERLPQPVFRDQSALVIALDLSRSMDAGDLKPSRVIRAKQKITDILKARADGQTALLVYAGDAYAVTPLSDDTQTLLAQLVSLDTDMMPAQGSRADLALDKARDLFTQAGETRGLVLLVTDGIESPKFSAALDALHGQGYRLSILGVGSREGAPIPLAEGGFLKDQQGAIVVPKLDEAVLREWAQRGSGRYALIRADDADIRYLLADIESHRLDQAKQAQGLTTDQWREQGPWLILLVLPLIALVFRRGVLLVLPLLLIAMPDPAQAVGWSDLWSRPDQQAMRALQAGDAAQAAQHFEDPQWKATAEYRAGQYEQSAKRLESIDTPEAHYNRGNALAQLGRYDEAMTAYEQALKQAPDHADARHNLELLQKLQQQQQQQQQQDQQSASSDGEQGESSASDDARAGQDQSASTATGKDQAEEEGQPQQADDKQADTASASENQADADDSNPSGQASDQQAGEKSAASAEPNQSATAEDGADKQAQSSAEDNSAQNPDMQPSAQASAQTDKENRRTQAASEQWLRRIPDDPGGLLRRKFRYQYQQRDGQAEPEAQAW